MKAPGTKKKRLLMSRDPQSLLKIKCDRKVSPSEEAILTSYQDVSTSVVKIMMHTIALQIVFLSSPREEN
jgi:hypothetical protein